MDLLLETPEHLTPRTPRFWVQEHWKRMQRAKQLVMDKHKKVATATRGPVTKTTKHARVSKLESKWECTPYQMVWQPFPLTPVYLVVSERPDPAKTRLHWNMLGPFVLGSGNPRIPTDHQEVF